MAIDNYTKLLLHCDGVDGSFDFADSGVTGHTVTSYNVPVDDATAVFGQSALFGGGQWLGIPDHDDWDFTGDFCIDFRTNIHSLANSHAVFIDASSSPRLGIYYYHPSNVLYAFGFAFPWTPALDTWYHVAVTRSGSDLRVFIDGQQIGSTQTLSGTVYGSSLYIGAAFNMTVPLIGWMDEIRISNGTARWTSNFTPPVSPYGTVGGLDAYTKLLLHLDGNFSDSSGNHHDFSANGTVSFSASPAKFGQAAYIAGYGNCLRGPVTADMQFGASAFTIDFWVYLTDLSSSNSFFELNYYGSGMYFNSTSTALLPHYFNTGSYRTVPWSPEINTWYHIAWARDDAGTVYLFLNGILLDTWTDTANLQPSIGSNNFYLGNTGHDLGRTLDGHIDEFRVSKGIARWTANFTPPGAPYGDVSRGADANSLLLMHMDSDEFVDAANRHVITAYNGAVTTGGDFRFGPAALAIAGIGDYLSVPDSPDWSFGTGDLTIEMWLKLPSGVSNADSGLLGTCIYNAGGIETGEGWCLRLRSGEGYSHRMELALLNPESTPTVYAMDCELPLGEWFHFAMTRASGSLRFFLNGELVNSLACSAEIVAGSVIGWDSGLKIGIGYVPFEANDPGSSQECLIDELRISDVARWTADFVPPKRAYGSWNIAGADVRVGSGGMRRAGGIFLADMVALVRLAGVDAQVDIRLLAELGKVSGLGAALRIAGNRYASLNVLASIIRNEVLRSGGAGGWSLDITAPTCVGGGGWADVAARAGNGLVTQLDLAGGRRAGVDLLGELRLAMAAGMAGQTEVWTREGYAVWLEGALADGTPVPGGWLGDIPAEPDGSAGETNALTLGALADGVYTVSIRPRGRFWRETGTGKVVTVVVNSGIASAVTLPAVTGVSITYERGLTAISWTLPEAFGAESVARFGLWYVPGGQDPDLEAAPDDMVSVWEGVRARYQAFWEQLGGAAEVVAICCLDAAGNRGPAVLVDLPELSDAPLSPANQIAKAGK